MAQNWKENLQEQTVTRLHSCVNEIIPGPPSVYAAGYATLQAPLVNVFRELAYRTGECSCSGSELCGEIHVLYHI